MSADAIIPRAALPHGTVVYELRDAPAVGDTIAVHSRGRVYPATVVKVTPTRIQAAYSTPSNPGTITRPWIKLAHMIDAPAPHPEHIALGFDGEHDPTYQRAWTIVAPRFGGRGGVKLEPVPLED